VDVSVNCPNGSDIRARYDVSYTSSSGTSSITTCFVNGTNCNDDGLCRHVLQNNNGCEFNSESVTVTVTAENIVGRGNSTSELFIVLLSPSASNCTYLLLI